MSNVLFDRTWNLSISKNGVNKLTFSSDESSGSEKNNHRIAFECSPYAGMGMPGYIEIQIYNLSQDLISKISPGDSIELSVGYKLSGSGLIFKGQIYSFYGSLVPTGKDINYIFNLYCYSYFDEESDKNKFSSAVSFDLPKGDIDSQAKIIAKYYGYSQNKKNILSSALLKKSPDIKIVADNMDEALLEFYKKTKYYLMFDVRNKTYNLMPAQPTRSQINEIFSRSQTSSSLIEIENNTGMIGFPNFDSQTSYLKVKTLIRHELDYFSSISVDLSNSVIENIKKNLSQDIVVRSRQYQSFIIVSLSYKGDTRGLPWYQEILGVGQP